MDGIALLCPLQPATIGGCITGPGIADAQVPNAAAFRQVFGDLSHPMGVGIILCTAALGNGISQETDFFRYLPVATDHQGQRHLLIRLHFQHRFLMVGIAASGERDLVAQPFPHLCPQANGVSDKRRFSADLLLFTAGKGYRMPIRRFLAPGRTPPHPHAFDRPITSHIICAADTAVIIGGIDLIGKEQRIVFSAAAQPEPAPAGLGHRCFQPGQQLVSAAGSTGGGVVLIKFRNIHKKPLRKERARKPCPFLFSYSSSILEFMVCRFSASTAASAFPSLMPS